jgi:hypothetical protein
MRQFLPLASIVFLFSSCTTYQYMTVSSKMAKQNDRQEFVVENDSVLVKYNFSGQDAPINVEITNKLDKPLYVDWKRSALIVGDKAISYVPTSVPISGSVVTSSSSFLSAGNFVSTTSQGSFSGKMGVPTEMDFIPPGTSKSKTPMGVTNHAYPVPKEKQERVQLQLESSYTGAALVSRFADSTSPLHFSSYLTLYAEGSFEEPLVLKHNFYISEIYTTSLAPRNFSFVKDKKGNRFYVSRVNGFGKVAGGFGVLAGLALVTYGNEKLEEKSGTANYRYHN